jgi:4-amino-4-deoxychorismate lyase
MSPKERTRPLLLETIKIENGEIFNLDYHQKRSTQSRKVLFNCTDLLDLSSLIHPPKKGLYRCRVLYTETLHSIEYIPYTAKEIHTLKIVPSQIKYNYKYANRDTLNTLLHAHQDVDEVIIEKNGYLTDVTIANIAFYDGERWMTPLAPLLKGTMRAKLLDEGFLHTANIKREDLSRFSKVALINAMVGFKVLNDIKIQDLKGNHYDY